MGLGTNWETQRPEQFPHLGNYTLTPAIVQTDTATVLQKCATAFSTFWQFAVHKYFHCRKCLQEKLPWTVKGDNWWQ